MASQTSSQTPNKKRETVFLEFDNSGLSNMYKINLLFSLQKLKFIKPYRTMRVQTQYVVFEGRYILISASGRWEDKLRKWGVSIIHAYPPTRYEVLSGVTWVTPREPEQRTVPILKDIGPVGYHSPPKVDYNKVYTRQELDILLKGGVDPALSQSDSNS